MKIKILLVVAGLALAAFPALAQDATTNTVIFNGISFSFPSSLASNLNIVQAAADAPDLQQPGGPAVKHTEFTLYNGAPDAQQMVYGEGSISIYNTAAFAGYEQASTEFTNLQTLLTQRPDLTQYTVADNGTNANNLPYLPVIGAAQVVRANAQYFDAPAIQGVRYVTAFRQDVSPFTGSDDFRYTFQGLTNDGAYYIAATFTLDTALFPAEIPADFDYDALSADFAGYLTESIVTLNSAAPEAFTPSLSTLDNIIRSISVTPTVPVLPPTGVTPTPTEITGDATMGGLAGATWMLTSYGSPDSPTPVLEGTTVTLTFSGTGAGGNAGCNTYGGDFQYDNNTLAFGQMITTMMACEEGVMQQETAYLNALATATTYQLSANQLQISYDGGVLTFTAG